MLKQFKIQQVGELDNGRVAGFINKAIRTCAEDATTRPGIDKPRRVMVAIDITPVIDEHGAATEIDMDFEIGTKLPRSRTKTVNMKAQNDGALLFNDLSQDDVRQTTIDEHHGQVQPEIMHEDPQ